MALSEILEILDACGFLGELKIKIAESGFESRVAHHGAEHVEEHGTFVHHDGAVVGGIGGETAGLANGGGVLVHQRADGEFVNGAERSEEHTSELQSQSNLVCRLLLEKKKAEMLREFGVGLHIHTAEA